jgi:WD40 repeat protein
MGSGEWTVFSVPKMDVLQTRRDHVVAINDAKFNMNGSLLAVACMDGAVDILQNDDSFSPVSFISCPVGVLRVDWANEGELLQLQDVEGRAIVYDAIKAARMEFSKSKLSKIRWNTDTCVGSFNLSGLVDNIKEGVNVNAVDVATSKRVAATVDDFGFVRLFRYPATSINARSKRYAGHSARVAGVKFSFRDKFVLTTGSGDHGIFQWFHIQE